MQRRPLLVSLISILVVALGSLLATVVAGNTPQLGLDLQGGASVTLRPVGSYTAEALDEIPNIYRDRIDSLGVAEPEILRQGDTIVVNLPGVKDKEKALELIGTTGKVVFRPVTGSPLPADPPIDFSKIGTGETISVGQVGSDTTVTVAGATAGPSDSTIASASTAPGDTTAGATADSTAATTVGTTAGADTATSAAGPARLPHQSATTSTVVQSAATVASATTTTTPTATSADTTVGTEASATTADPNAPTTTLDPNASTTTADPNASTTTVDPNAPTTTSPPFDLATLITPVDQDLPESPVILPNRDGTAVYQLGPAFARGEFAIDSATARIDNGQYSVELVLKRGADGLDAWNTMAAKCYAALYSGGDSTECSGGMAFVLDHRVISAPSPSQESGGFFSSPNIQITGNFSREEASQLERVLKYGATPVEMKAQAAQTVSATLGKDSLRAAVIAGLIGIGLVLLFMLFYYRSLALVVVLGLFVSGALLYSLISLLSRTSGLAMTLAGVTGIIVSVGVTVDSYVVFFERLKDDVKGGKTFRSSAQRGFKSAWRTILAADIVSLIGAGTLFMLTVGSVKGFAFFLGLSTLCDLVVSYLFTRPAVLLLARSRRYRNNRLLGVGTGDVVGGAA